MMRLLLAVVLMSGCAALQPTPYQPMAYSGGYRDYPAGDRIYIEFYGNAYTDRSTAHMYWHRRAAEICGGPQSYTVVDAQQENEVTDMRVDKDGDVDTTTKPRVMGYIRCVQGPQVASQAMQ